LCVDEHVDDYFCKLKISPMKGAIPVKNLNDMSSEDFIKNYNDHKFTAKTLEKAALHHAKRLNVYCWYEMIRKIFGEDKSLLKIYPPFIHSKQFQNLIINKLAQNPQIDINYTFISYEETHVSADKITLLNELSLAEFLYVNKNNDTYYGSRNTSKYMRELIKKDMQEKQQIIDLEKESAKLRTPQRYAGISADTPIYDTRNFMQPDDAGVSNYRIKTPTVMHNRVKKFIRYTNHGFVKCKNEFNTSEELKKSLKRFRRLTVEYTFQDMVRQLVEDLEVDDCTFYVLFNKKHSAWTPAQTEKNIQSTLYQLYCKKIKLEEELFNGSSGGFITRQSADQQEMLYTIATLEKKNVKLQIKKSECIREYFEEYYEPFDTEITEGNAECDNDEEREIFNLHEQILNNSIKISELRIKMNSSINEREETKILALEIDKLMLQLSEFTLKPVHKLMSVEKMVDEKELAEKKQLRDHVKSNMHKIDKIRMENHKTQYKLSVLKKQRDDAVKANNLEMKNKNKLTKCKQLQFSQKVIQSRLGVKSIALDIVENGMRMTQTNCNKITDTLSGMIKRLNMNSEYDKTMEKTAMVMSDFMNTFLHNVTIVDPSKMTVDEMYDNIMEDETELKYSIDFVLIEDFYNQLNEICEHVHIMTKESHEFDHDKENKRIAEEENKRKQHEKEMRLERKKIEELLKSTLANKNEASEDEKVKFELFAQKHYIDFANTINEKIEYVNYLGKCRIINKMSLAKLGRMNKRLRKLIDMFACGNDGMKETLVEIMTNACDDKFDQEAENVDISNVDEYERAQVPIKYKIDENIIKRSKIKIKIQHMLLQMHGPQRRIQLVSTANQIFQELIEELMRYDTEMQRKVHSGEINLLDKVDEQLNDLFGKV
jgi:hypothetical protein